VERVATLVLDAMGTDHTMPALPPPRSRYLHVYAFLAVLPAVRAYHQARGVPDEVSRLTLADLGRQIAVHRRRRGYGGLDEAPWLTRHFRGSLYQLGRLQFERVRLGGRTGTAIAAAGLPLGPGDPALAVHIPEFSGPLSPELCSDSFARAVPFFAGYHDYSVAICHSWLLDEQLRDYLPDTANIIRFQRRFRPAYRPEPDDATIIRFVFGALHSTVDVLPQDTALQRAIVTHLRAGRHWYGGAGWLPLNHAGTLAT
jgi:hypothetical protein